MNSWTFIKNENSMNMVMLTGRIVSDIFYLNKSTMIDDHKMRYDRICSFILMVQVDKQKQFFKIIVPGKNEIKKIKNYAEKGCRITIMGHLESRKRTGSNVKAYHIQRYATDVVADNVVEIYDKFEDYSEQLKAYQKKVEIQQQIEKLTIPTLNEFDNEY